MQKPTSMIVKETKEKIVNDLNESKLPMFVLEPIIKDIYEQIVQAKNQEYEMEKQAYEKSLKEKEDKDEQD